MFKGNGEFYITNEDPGLAAIFATYPAPYVSILGCIIDQVLLQTKFFKCSKTKSHVFTFF